jgi:hypothetical protein
VVSKVHQDEEYSNSAKFYTNKSHPTIFFNVHISAYSYSFDASDDEKYDKESAKKKAG